jgi:hypothetical protein
MFARLGSSQPAQGADVIVRAESGPAVRRAPEYSQRG